MHTGNETVHILANERTEWNEASAKKHEHENQTVLDEISAESVARWNNMSEQVISGNEIISDTEPDNQNITSYWLLEYE